MRVIDLTFATPDLKLTPDYSTTFRDFSGTTRIGELGQAVCWAYFNSHLPHSLFVDYNEGRSIVGLPELAGGPDFFVLHQAVPDFILLECKGTASKSGGPSLQKGLAQATGAVAELASVGLSPSRSLAAIVRFSHTHGARIAFRDPAKKAKVTNDTYEKLRRVAYAPFFQAAGSEVSNLLWNGEPVWLEPRPSESSLIKVGETDEFECYVNRKALAFLTGQRRRGRPPSAKNNAADIEVFGDGTAMRAKRNLKKTLHR